MLPNKKIKHAEMCHLFELQDQDLHFEPQLMDSGLNASDRTQN